MRSSFRTIIGGAAVALGVLSAAGAANAGQYSDARVYYSHAPQVVVPVAPPAYAQYEGHEGRRYGRESQRDQCAAPRWNPQQRYMPGETVRRHGEFYMARRISGHVWNVNSPPEWTPNYWRPVQC